MYAIITGAQEKCARLSFGAISLLYGLLKTVMAKIELQPPVKPPVRRRLDFEYVFDIETDDEDGHIQCGQRKPLVKLEIALQPGYIGDGWMTARVRDIPWLSEFEMSMIPPQKHQRSSPDFLGISIDVPTASSMEISQRSYNMIVTPSSVLKQFTTMPPELIFKIFDKVCIKDILNLSETCKYFYELSKATEFWRQRLMRDFKVVIITNLGQRQKSA